MTSLAFDWNIESLRSEVDAAWPGMSVDVVASVGSTNDVLIERVRSRADSGSADGLGASILVAERQSAGRGRVGRSWSSAPESSLTFSVAVRLECSDWSGLSLAVGVSLIEALEGLVPGFSSAIHSEQDRQCARLLLKWPNDVVILACHEAEVAAVKLAGILIESVSSTDGRWCIVGAGINLRHFDSDAVFSTGFGCLTDLGVQISPPCLFRKLIAPLLRDIQLFDLRGFYSFEQRFHERNFLTHSAVTTNSNDCPVGVVVGVDGAGALLVRRSDGVVCKIVSGEVSVRRLGPATEFPRC